MGAPSHFGSWVSGRAKSSTTDLNGGIVANRAQVAVACALLLLWSVPAHAQSDLIGTVFRIDGPRVPIASAEVSAPKLKRAVVTDSLGRFRLLDVTPGRHLLVIRAPGYAADSAEVDFEENETVVRDFELQPAEALLPEVRVRAEGNARATDPRLAGFIERRRRGLGHFLDREALARWEGRRTADALRHVPGLDVRRGSGEKAWVSAGRWVNENNACAFCEVTKEEMLHPVDVAAGAVVACYADVYLDGALIFAFSSGGVAAVKAPLFDVNSIPISQIEAIEFYASVAQVPAMFNRTAGRCGVLVIWTRA